MNRPKFIIDSPHTGKVEWQLPEDLAKCLADLAKRIRTSASIPEDLASIAEKEEIERITSFIQIFFLTLAGAMFVQGGPACEELRSHIQHCLGLMATGTNNIMKKYPR